ncbi:MAG TPA: hypothetical protein VKI44_05625 [Acetobacteraceae bacterium]|nr:hypothetical protein [Acetobacteraceae bacterium]
MDDEGRMRHALGLADSSSSSSSSATHFSSGPSQAHRPRRFVKDGEIPVILLNAGRDRSTQISTMAKQLADAKAAIRNEQAARATAERALADALATIQRLRTQLAHAEMSHAETLDAERKRREALDQALLEAADIRESLEKQLADDASTGRQDVKALPTRAEPCPVPEQHERRGTRPNAAREPEPVKWWLPSYKAQFGKNSAKSRR